MEEGIREAINQMVAGFGINQLRRVYRYCVYIMRKSTGRNPPEGHPADAEECAGGAD